MIVEASRNDEFDRRARKKTTNITSSPDRNIVGESGLRGPLLRPNGQREWHMILAGCCYCSAGGRFESGNNKPHSIRYRRNCVNLAVYVFDVVNVDPHSYGGSIDRPRCRVWVPEHGVANVAATLFPTAGIHIGYEVYVASRRCPAI